MHKLKVNVDLKLSGELVKENKEFIFSYKDEDKNSFISLIMPVREKPY